MPCKAQNPQNRYTLYIHCLYAQNIDFIMTHLCFSRTSWELLKQKKTKFPSNKTGGVRNSGEKKSLRKEPRPPGWARNLLAPHPVRRTRKRYRRRGSPTVVRMWVVALVGIELLLLLMVQKSGENTHYVQVFYTSKRWLFGKSEASTVPCWDDGL